MHKAPREERGLISTRCAPTLMEEIIDTALPPPILVIRSGTNGIKVGRTTPDELENNSLIDVLLPNIETVSSKKSLIAEILDREKGSVEIINMGIEKGFEIENIETTLYDSIIKPLLSFANK